LTAKPFGSKPLCYTVWSRGTLIGETDLDFWQITKNFRTGWFLPAANVDRLMSVLALAC